MTKAYSDLIRARLKDLHTRGVFKSFNGRQDRAGRLIVQFSWLMGQEFIFVIDASKGEVVVKNLLPKIEGRSFMNKDLRQFIVNRTDKKLPAHRRVNPRHAEIFYKNYKQNVWLTMAVYNNQYAYAVGALLKTINDLFSYLSLYHIDYLYHNFGLPEE